MKIIRIIAGTNRVGNNTLKVSNELLKSYRELGVEAEIIDLADLPAEIFNSNAYHEKPAGWHQFQEKIDSADGLVVVVPEYNGSFPGVLKYFIDMLEFPKSLQDKPCCFIGLSAGVWGGLRAVEHMQDIFIYRGALIFPKSVFIPEINLRLNAEGYLTDVEILQRLKKQASSFVDFVNRSGKKD